MEQEDVFYGRTNALAIYAEGEFGKGQSKTAEGVIRYGQNPVVCVIDSSQAGKTAGDVMKTDSTIPIVASISEALAYAPKALLLGTAWNGGQLPDAWRADVSQALKAGLDVINGLHDFLSDDAEFLALANKSNCRLIDVRRARTNLPVAQGAAAQVEAFTVLTVGSDCSVGKITVSLELCQASRRKGHSAQFVATGQTGIMIEGKGHPVDCIVGDFMAGAVEELVVQAAKGNEFVFVEGQGSLIHPGFSGVTMAILHGSCPKAMVLCHKPSRQQIKHTHFAIPKLSALIPVYEGMASWLKKSKVVAIALNTSDLSEAEARSAIAEAEADTGLPADDPVRFGADKLFAQILQAKEKQS